MRKLIFLMPMLVLFGCATAINEHNAELYTREAADATQQGDWDRARRLWARAVGNSSLANSDKRFRAVVNYEYARSLGVTCFYDLSLQYFDLAYKFDKETNGPSYMSLVEAARMLSAKGDDGNAIKYYERAVKEGYAAQLPQNDPIGFADFITDYAEALSAIGQSALAGEQREMAQTLRQNNPGKESKTDLVPYGQQCTNPEHSDNRSNKSPQPTQ